jgi:hypothetical protein
MHRLLPIRGRQVVLLTGAPPTVGCLRGWCLSVIAVGERTHIRLRTLTWLFLLYLLLRLCKTG